MLRPIFRRFNRIVASSRAFSSQSSGSDDGDDLKNKLKSVKDTDAIDEELLKAATSAIREKHPTNRQERVKGLNTLIGKLKEASHESSKKSQEGLIEEVIETIKNVKVEQPTLPITK